MNSQKVARLIPIARSRPSKLLPALLAAGTLLLIGAAVLQFLPPGGPGPPVGGGLSFSIAGKPLTTIDYEQTAPIYETTRGVNVFPMNGTTAKDGAHGFMSYSPQVAGLMKQAGIKMLRFPGGNWGDEHDPSYDQLDAFIRLADELDAESAIQVRLKGGSVAQALGMLDYLNNPQNPERQRRDAPFRPVKYWIIGNEPSGYEHWGNLPVYTAADYARDFIQYAEALKAVDPSVKLIGDEQHQYSLKNDLKDSSGADWMRTFLAKVAEEERKTGKTLLDVVSFHRYPLHDSWDGPTVLSDAPKYRGLVDKLRSEVLSALGRSCPIAITEIGAMAETSIKDDFGEDSVLSALWWADSWGALASSGAEYLFFFAAQGLDPPLALISTAEQPLPAYYAFAQTRLLTGEMATDVYRDDRLSIYVADDTEDRHLSIMLINKSKSKIGQVLVQDLAGSVGPKTPAPFELPPLSMTVVVLRADQSMDISSYGYEQAQQRSGIVLRSVAASTGAL
ncbi:MAG: glycoside hydrolase family 44 protein [Candidatus Marsarchaeota archaeon]|nr:glycoside hydrolase family 44 protein [Candidatus Marsarchaeota archaeon]